MAAASPMSREEWCECLTKNYTLLIDYLELDDGYLLNDLRTNKVLNRNQFDDLKSKANRRQIAEGLVDMLLRINTENYLLFFTILQKYQPDLVKSLGAESYFPSLIHNSSQNGDDGDVSKCSGSEIVSLQSFIIDCQPRQNITNYHSEPSGSNPDEEPTSNSANIYELITKSESTQEVMHHLSNTNLNLLHEYDTIITVMQWIKERDLSVKEITELLNMMYLEWLSQGDLQSLLSNYYSTISHHQYIALEKVVNDVIEWTMKWSKISGQWGKPSDVSNSARPRPGLPCLVFVGGTRGLFRNISDTVDFFKTTGERFERKSTLPSPRYQAGVVSDSLGCVYVTGGLDKHSATNSIFKFDHQDSQWTTLKPMQHKRCSHITCLTNKNLFVVGGRDSTNEILISIEIYDIFADEWQNGADYPMPICDGSAACYNDTCVVGGGITTGNTPVSSIYIYELRSQQWQHLAATSQPKYEHIMATVNNKIYLIGGRGNSSAEIFKPDIEHMSFVTTPPQHQFSSNAVVYNDCIIVCHPTLGYDSKVYIFNTVSKKWSTYKVYLPCPKTHLGLTFV